MNEAKVKAESSSAFAAAASIAEDPTPSSELVDQQKLLDPVFYPGSPPQDMMNAQFDSEIADGHSKEKKAELERERVHNE